MALELSIILSTKGKKFLICENCGEEFVASSKIKRTICEKCYKEYRKEYKKQKNQSIQAKGQE